MEGFLLRNKDKFIEYALRDALISLVHASWMEDFNFKIGFVGIPLSLSSLGRNYVRSLWKEEGYSGYQISSKYLLGDVSTAVTPKGLNEIKDIGFVLPYYISNYKGGRNECFMFGVDRDRVWYDYDLTSAYTTIMSMAGHPDYGKSRKLKLTELKSLSKEEMLYSYLIVHADFEFPPETKYPSIPCYVDENCTVYPLKGSCVITGAEYILAKSQNCSLKIHEIILTPFKHLEYKENKPFASIFKIVQEQRREHTKGTISNLIYKEIGNSIYGSVVRGIGNKKRFDIKSKNTVRMEGDDLTNPLVASWTTAFVRSIIGECLQGIQDNDGLVVSATTDGFITNVKDLEVLISKSFLFCEFKQIRKSLSGNNTGLEIKSSGKGVIAWSTRGQLGLESDIIATTGFQHQVYKSKKHMLDGMLDLIKSEHKTMEFTQSRLRSAADVYNKGGHVTMQYRDQIFRMHYDNRRVLNWNTTIPSSVECLVDSIPLETVTQGKNLRFIGRMSKTKLYGKYTSEGRGKSKTKEDMIVRYFIYGLLSQPPKFKLNRNELKSYQLIAEFLHSFNPQLKISASGLAKLKYRINKNELKCIPVQKSYQSEEFVKYVQQRFEDFDVEAFYGYKS